MEVSLDSRSETLLWKSLPMSNLFCAFLCRKEVEGRGDWKMQEFNDHLYVLIQMFKYSSLALLVAIPLVKAVGSRITSLDLLSDYIISSSCRLTLL